MYTERRHEGDILFRFGDINELLLAEYHVRPYEGCEFGCAYCDAWSYSEAPINERICSYSNFIDKLAEALSSIAPDAFIGFTFGDAYQPAEQQYRTTRKALQLLERSNRPVVLLTKSPVIKDDLDLFKQLNTNGLAIVVTTLVTLDTALLSHLESTAPSPSERISIIESFADSGVPRGVALIPIIPFVTDNRRDLRRLIERVAAAKPDFMIWEYLWLPNPRYKTQLESLLQRIDKTLYKKIETLYQGNPIPDSDYRNSMNRFLIDCCRQAGIEPRIPPELYRNHMALEKVGELMRRNEKFLSA